ncbi:helix-turn-helix domain-containing protein [Loigolactobacillus backii]|uniref:helix-turn-helix domain-containing protein n=1 Tax=Loigolactobacillus backii TaxID=375175 RepID=UPI000C1C9271|nr:helix-turn-helix transcriptional regulator [Loigolactobacillus backii]MDA5388577.1 helix-turn-helix domain-containing protein [Loigolactobacillus backii]MDA5391031.1 helix-turn-helix domain-containing protein [Loigolactobacillus backii]PIO83804.1 hypothetical protein BSQ39_09605 [Loigolactobacillus backii]
MIDIDNRFSNALKYVRTHTPYNGKKGMSLRDLSAESGVSTPYISQLEQISQNRTPSLETIVKLSTGLTRPTKLNSSTMTEFLSAMAGYKKPDPRFALRVAKTLSDTNFKDFLQLIVGYTGTIDLDDPDDDKIANTAYLQWDKEELATNKLLLDQYMAASRTLYLSMIDHDSTKVILDSKELTNSELLILRSTIQTIRQLRKTGQPK